MKYLLLLLTLTACESSQDGKEGSSHGSAKVQTLSAKKLAVTWMKNCEYDNGHVSIPDSFNEATIEVSPNQIVIGARIDTTAYSTQNKILFFLNGPGDLGRGGLNLNWDDFSKDSIIAEMHSSSKSDKSCSLKWFGFYDRKLRKRVWIHEFAMLVDEKDLTKNSIEIINCDN